MKLYRSALMAGLLALGVAACGDDVEVVSPAPPVVPPPPPVTATMAPASASVAVGNSVVFAVNASGGVAGEAASWTCSSSNTGIATVSSTSAGCQATGVVAGSVTVTASVSKSGETVNVGAQLTVTSDEVVGTAGEPAFVLVRSVTADTDDGSLSGILSVEVGVERGDQTLEQLSLLVDGEVVAYQSFGSTMGMAPPEDEAAEQAVHPFNFSFDSGDYGDDGTPSYMNGEHTIAAELQIAGGMMPDGMMGHETVSSNAIAVEFDNDDGVHVTADFPGNSAMNPETGQIWYGGPDAGDFTITVAPVLFAGGSASSVTLLGVCGADAATDSEAPYEFTLECEKSGSVTPMFSIAAGGETLLDLEPKNESIFPLNLDYEGPEPPIFKANVNKREDGWINAAVDLVGKYSSRTRPNGWLQYGADDPGVGGYIAQLRISATTPDIVDGARAESASSSPTLPAASKKDVYCVIASATDLLGNESKRPSAGKSCPAAASHEEGDLVTDLEEAETAVEDAEEPTADQLDDVQKARIALSAIKAGVDVTAPTIKFTGVSPSENDRDLQKEFQVQVTDSETNASKLHSVPVLAKVEIRDEKGKVLCGNDDDEALPGEEKTTGECILNAENGLLVDADGALVTTTGVAAAETVGYYTFTALSRDKAGNRSEEISRVALEDTEAPGAGLIVGAFNAKKSSYPVTVTATDNLSIRDGYLAMLFSNDREFRLPKVTVDAYNDALTQTVPLSITIGAFRALQSTTAESASADEDDDDFGALNTVAGAADAIESIDVVVRDQSSNPGTTGDDSETSVAADPALEAFATREDEEQSTTHFEAFVEEDDLEIDDVIEISVLVVGDGEVAIPAVLGDNPATPDVTETDFVTTAAVPAVPFKNPFLRVDYYALGDGGSYRSIGSQLANSAGLEDTDDDDDDVARRTYTYEIEISAALVYAAADDDGRGDYGDTGTDGAVVADGNIIAVGVRADGLGLASQPVAIAIDK